MEFIKEALKKLCSLMTLSGHESKCKEELFELMSPYFDKMSLDKFGNFIFVKKCGKENAPALMLDAHLDQIGLMVRDIHEGGFLSLVNVGGLNSGILPSEEVYVYGKEKIYGVISSIPPHLRKDSSAIPTIEELYVDTGYEKEELEKLVSIGAPVVMAGKYTELQNDRISAGSLDDKACVCALLDAVRRMEREKMKYDVYVTVSAQEETGKCGAAICAYNIKPEIAIITDVNFGDAEKDEGFEFVKLGEGAAIDVSAMTDRRLTRAIMRLLDKEGVKYQKICEPSYTYTNNDLVSVTGEGVPTLLMSVPLRSMHTPVETVDAKDIRSLADILMLLAYTDKGAL